MSQRVFLASTEDLEADGFPGQRSPVIAATDIDLTLRAHLYALLLGISHQEGLELELPVDDSYDGGGITRLDGRARSRLAKLAATEMEALAENWSACREAEDAELDTDVLVAFIADFASLCQTCEDDPDLAVYVLDEPSYW